jgi:hypothetical protein
MMILDDYKTFLVGTRTEKALLEEERQGLVLELEAAEKRAEALRLAQDIMNEVGVLAQSEIKDVIEHLVSQALQFTHGENYAFEIDNRISRNQPETYMYVLIDGQRNSLKDELGGSVVDVVCFALRVVFWAIQVPRTRPLILLDEPFKNGGKQEALCQMIKHLSDLLGIQFVIVTYDDRIVVIADTCYRVTQANGTSDVERIK